MQWVLVWVVLVLSEICGSLVCPTVKCNIEGLERRHIPVIQFKSHPNPLFDNPLAAFLETGNFGLAQLPPVPFPNTSKLEGAELSALEADH